jgi:hypothetical protein
MLDDPDLTGRPGEHGHWVRWRHANGARRVVEPGPGHGDGARAGGCLIHHADARERLGRDPAVHDGRHGHQRRTGSAGPDTCSSSPTGRWAPPIARRASATNSPSRGRWLTSSPGRLRYLCERARAPSPHQTVPRSAAPREHSSRPRCSRRGCAVLSRNSIGGRRLLCSAVGADPMPERQRMIWM